MTILIRGGTVVDADRTYRADVLCATRRRRHDPRDRRRSRSAGGRADHRCAAAST